MSKQQQPSSFPWDEAAFLIMIVVVCVEMCAVMHWIVWPKILEMMRG